MERILKAVGRTRRMVGRAGSESLPGRTSVTARRGLAVRSSRGDSAGFGFPSWRPPPPAPAAGETAGMQHLKLESDWSCQHIGAPASQLVWPLVQNVCAPCVRSARKPATGGAIRLVQTPNCNTRNRRGDSRSSDSELLVHKARDVVAVGAALGLAHDVADDRADRLGVAPLDALGSVGVGGQGSGDDRR